MVEVGRHLLQTELNLWTALTFGMWSVVSSDSGEGHNWPVEYMQLGIPPEREPISAFQSDTLNSNRLDYYCDQVGRCWDQLPDWLKSNILLK